MAQRTPAEERERWIDWIDDFAAIPVDLVEEACRMWRTTPTERFPTPGQLLAFVKGPAELRRYMVERLDALANSYGAARDAATKHEPEERKDRALTYQPGEAIPGEAIEVIAPIADLAGSLRRT